MIKQIQFILLLIIPSYCFAQIEEQDSVLMQAEQAPQFPGGTPAMNQFIMNNTYYPATAAEKELCGSVFVNFIVRRDGKISDIKVLKGIKDAPELGEEAMRVIKRMPVWEPGKLNGVPVSVSLTLPIRFAFNKIIGNDTTRVKEQVPEDIVETVKEMPTFPGGEDKLYEFLGKNIRYPVNARDAHITGRVYISFVVEKDGMLSDFMVVRGIIDGIRLEEEAIRVLQLMPKWNPGKENGEVVATKMIIPVQFSIE